MNLKEYRTIRKYSQIEVAKLLGITQKTYSNYELGVTEPTIETLKKMADLYGTTIDNLVGRTESSEIDLLTNEQKLLVKLIKQLNEIEIIKATSYISGLIANR